MSIAVRRASEAELDDWDERVAASPQGTVFHTVAWLRVLERHSSTTLHPLVGYKGEEPIGLFPAFVLSKGPVNAVFSPPPRLGVPNLGPVLCNHRKLKQRKFESLNEGFIEGVLDWIDRELDPSYIRVETVPEYDDPRPFHRREFDVTPRYTYAVVTDDEAAVLDRFSRSVRRGIRNHGERCRIRSGDHSDATAIIEQVRGRYEEQGKSFDIGRDLVTDLLDTLPDDRLQVYVGEVDGELASGIITPTDEDRVYFWQGGVKPAVDPPINNLLHWHIIRDAIDRGRTEYDLVGANSPSLCAYKAKFNPRLVPYHVLETGTRLTSLASDVYKRLR
jgi:hypothetical protein